MLVLEAVLAAVVGLKFVEIVPPKKRHICSHITSQKHLNRKNHLCEHMLPKSTPLMGLRIELC